LMKGLPLTLLACVLLAGAANAQTISSQTPEPQKETAQASSPELDESMKLSAEVVRLYKAGKYDKALPLAKRALQLREKTLAPGHKLIVDSLTNLAELYAAKHDYGTARDYYQRVLAIYEQSPPPNRVQVAQALNHAGYFSYQNFDFERAEKYFQRALALREELAGAESVETARAAFNLAEFYRLRGEDSKAEPLYVKSIETLGKALGPGDDEVAHALDRFSCLYYATNRWEKLKEIRQQFTFMREQDVRTVDKGDVLNGRAISLPKPDYPREAMQHRVSGTVVVRVKIDERGNVISADEGCGAHPLLVGAAVRAALQAHFTPTLLKGMPVKVTGIITYKFVAW
jgi:TonB family protein